MTAIDPHRTLGLTPGASQAEIKRAYRHLAKLYHPDSAGERALPRFLAIQAAYEALLVDPRRPRTAGRGATTDRPAGPPPPSWQADPTRARATREAYRARTRRAAGAAGSAGAAPSAGPAGGAAASSTAGAGSRTDPGGPAGAGHGGATGRPGRARDDSSAAGARTGGGGRAGRSTRRPKATIGSTSYDGADKEPFTPAWEGATWYGAGSGTYWTLNPKEYADPRKHGPEYLARSMRGASAARPETPNAGGDATTASPSESAHPDPSPAPGAPATDGPPPDAGTAPGSTTSHRPAGAGASTSADGPAPRSAGRSVGGSVSTPSHGAAGEAAAGATARSTPGGPWPGAIGGAEPRRSDPAGDPPPLILRLSRSLVGRVALALIAWIPLGVALAAASDALPACGANGLVCSDPLRAGFWPVDVLLIAIFVAVPRLGAIGVYGAAAFFVVGLLGTPVLLAIGGAHTPSGTAGALAVVLILAWVGGVLLALSGRVDLPPWRGARTMLR